VSAAPHTPVVAGLRTRLDPAVTLFLCIDYLIGVDSMRPSVHANVRFYQVQAGTEPRHYDVPSVPVNMSDR